jgi:hypothetical protein
MRGFFASLRMTSERQRQKATAKAKAKQQQIAPLRCGMTNKRCCGVTKQKTGNDPQQIPSFPFGCAQGGEGH